MIIKNKIYCPDDNEYRIYCDICDNFAEVGFYNNHQKSRTHIYDTHKRQQLKKHHHNFLFPKISYKKNELPCDTWFQKVEFKPKGKHLKSLTHNQLAKCMRIIHNIGNPDIFPIDSFFKDYTTNENKKLDTYLVINDQKLVFDSEFYPHVKFEFLYNIKNCHLKKFLLIWIEFFTDRG